jgi:hypothetical protein
VKNYNLKQALNHDTIISIEEYFRIVLLCDIGWLIGYSSLL